jgi:hypothetical protein
MNDLDLMELVPVHVASVTMDSLALLPSALVDEACYGAVELPELFERYGYTPDTAEVFRTHPYWKKLITVRTAELDKEGLTHRMKAGAVADVALGSLYRRVSDPNTATTVVLDIYKATSKNAGFEPKTSADVAPGAGFSINIIMPNATTKASLPVHPIVDVVEMPLHMTFEANPAEFEVA